MDPVTRALLRTLAAALALGPAIGPAPAAGATAAGPAPAWESPPVIPAESDLFLDRMADPGYHFLLDGQHALMAGRDFHQVFGEANHFLWPAHPWLRLLPDRRWFGDSTAWTFRAQVGNEVGDPLLRELDGEDAEGNRTPYTAGSLTFSPTGEWSLNAGLDQNDHFSQRTFPARMSIVGKQRRDDLAWIGGNLPPKSAAQFGAAMHRHGGMIAAQFNRGWWWTNSPVSGMPYAWEGFNAEFHTRAGDDFDLTLADQSWESPAPESFQASRWRRTEITLGVAGGGPGGWRWRLEVGGQRRSLWSDSAFRRFEENTYPWRFRYRQRWSPEAASFFRLENQGNLGARERLFSFQHASELRETFGPSQLSQTLRVYYRNPFGSYIEPTEILNADTSWTAVLDPASHARGFSGGGEYRFKKSFLLASVSGYYAMEWGLPVFRGAVVDSLDGLLIRSGVLRGVDEPVAGYGGKAQLGGPLWPTASWRLQGGIRGAHGETADSLEIRPSPWWLGAGLAFEFPSDLRVDGILHWVGPKEVRGWGPDFEVPSHLEGNVALVQSLFDGRMDLWVSLLNAFGEDVLEHPNGNPLVFRILVGAKGSF